MRSETGRNLPNKRIGSTQKMRHVIKRTFTRYAARIHYVDSDTGIIGTFELTFDRPRKMKTVRKEALRKMEDGFIIFKIEELPPSKILVSMPFDRFYELGEKTMIGVNET